MNIPTAPVLQLHGEKVSIVLDSLLCAAIYAARTQAEGHAALQQIALVALAIGWTGAPKPWLAGLIEIRDAAKGEKGKYEAEIRGRAAGLSAEELRELKRDLANATDAAQLAEASLQAADIRDLPLDPAKTATVADSIKAALLGAGVPPMRLAVWLSEVIRYCDAVATSGYSEWMALEESGFSIPPEGQSSSGGLKSPDASAETLPAGSR